MHMPGKQIFILLDCGKCNGAVYGLPMIIDSLICLELHRPNIRC